MYTTQAENEKLCFRVLSEYLHILQDWKKRYAPQAPEEEPDDRFVEACHMLECTQYMLDLLTIGSHEERYSCKVRMSSSSKSPDKKCSHVTGCGALASYLTGSKTGRTHIPPRLFKEAVHLNRMKDQIMAILNNSNPFSKKSKAEELEALLDKYIPGVEAMRTKLKKYDKTYKELTAENAELEKELNSASRESIQKKLEIQRKLSELDELRRTMDSIPNAVIREYTEQKYVHHGRMNQEI